MKELLEYLPRMVGKRIGVYGDLIADEYVFGTINRFSREAPVFIVNYEESFIGLGGAANAANNVHELKGTVLPFGVVGDDAPGKALVSAIRERGIDDQGLILDPEHPTFVKQRIVAGSPHSVKQQILRLDRCCPLPADAACHEDLLRRMLEALPSLDALIISDYDLGVVQPEQTGRIVAEARRLGIRVFVDSRRRLSTFRGITAATPNEPEVEGLLGRQLDDASLPGAGHSLLDHLEAESLLITRGKNGMALFVRHEEPALIPIFGSTDIVDVTGAGDTVISTFALANAAGATFLDSARLANCAAGIVVMKRGAATVTPAELTEAIRVSEM